MLRLRIYYRYQDKRNYSDSMRSWKDGYVKHLSRRNSVEPKRLASIAIDVLLHYEQVCERQLTYENLSSCRDVSLILEAFKDKEGLKASSKIKYLKSLEKMLIFLQDDFTSPEFIENESSDAILKKQQQQRFIKLEFETIFEILSKQRGCDASAAREEAKKKLMSDDELSEVCA